MTTDYIGDGSPAALAAGLRQWVDSVPSHARPLLVAAADALAAPVAPASEPAAQVICPDPSTYTTAESNLLDRTMPVGTKLYTYTYAAPVAPAKPVAWIRYCSDSTYEGPIIHGRMEEVHKKSGAWTPLYEAPVAPALVPLTSGPVAHLWRSNAGAWLTLGDDADKLQNGRYDLFAHGIKP